jgi:hypothetical protein
LHTTWECNPRSVAARAIDDRYMSHAGRSEPMTSHRALDGATTRITGAREGVAAWKYLSGGEQRERRTIVTSVASREQVGLGVL